MNFKELIIVLPFYINIMQFTGRALTRKKTGAIEQGRF